MKKEDEERRVPIYDPRGSVGVDTTALSARVAHLDGLRVGILDNTKWNANKLLRHLRDDLQSSNKLRSVQYYRKESFSRVADPRLVAQIRAENDIALTAIGD